MTWADVYAQHMDNFVVIDDVGQALVAARGKTLTDITERLGEGWDVMIFEFSDGTIIEARSQARITLEVHDAHTGTSS